MPAPRMSGPPIQPVSQSKHIRLLVYGDNGIGKSRLAGTSPGRVLILRPPTDSLDSLLPADKSRVKEWVLHDHDDLQRALDYLRQHGHEWDWVWLDSISLWQDAGLDDLWETVIIEKPARARYGLDKAEYGINMTRLARWVRHVVGPDTFNFGVTAHAAMLSTSDDPEEPERLMPWVQGRQMPQKIAGYMNVVAFYEVAEFGADKTPKRVLRFDKTPRYWANDKFDAFLPSNRLIEPTMPKLITAIDKARGAAARTTTSAKPKATGKRVIKKGS